MFAPYISPSELYHHGIKGQKWGIRRYQNPDGSLTEAGRLRYKKGKTVLNYESARTRKYAKKYGTNSYEYQKSAELDEMLARRYRTDDSSALGIAKSVGKYLILGGASQQKTYEMARATGRGVVNSFLRAKLDISPAVLLSAATGALASNMVKSFETGTRLAEVIEKVGGGTMKKALEQSVSSAGDAAKALKDAGGIVIGASSGASKVPNVPIGSVPFTVGGSASSKVAGKMASDAQKILADPNRAKEFSKMLGQNAINRLSPAEIAKLPTPISKTPAQRAAGSIVRQATNIIPSSRGHEWSLQQQWLRSDYIRRGRKR